MHISLITVNYNSTDETIQFVNSVVQWTSPEIKYEIIVVDNASRKEERDRLFQVLDKQAKVRLIQNTINAGFSSGNMLGAAQATGAYLFFVNNDTVFLNDANKILFTFMEQHSDTGLVTAQLYDEDGRFTPSFHHFPAVLNKLIGNTSSRCLNPKRYPKQKKIYDHVLDVEVVSGSCMFTRAELFRRVGGLDTRFFLYCEEEDYSYRVKKSGYAVKLVPQARIKHLSGKSTVRNVDIEKEFIISYFKLLSKHYGFAASSVLKGLFVFKLFRRIFKDKINVTLFCFALNREKERYSLRYKQKEIDG